MQMRNTETIKNLYELIHKNPTSFEILKTAYSSLCRLFLNLPSHQADIPPTLVSYALLDPQSNTPTKYLEGIELLYGLHNKEVSLQKAVKIFETLAEESALSQHSLLECLSKLQAAVTYAQLASKHPDLWEYARASYIHAYTKTKDLPQHYACFFIQKIMIQEAPCLFKDCKNESIQRDYKKIIADHYSHETNPASLTTAMNLALEIKHDDKTLYQRIAENAQKIARNDISLDVYKNMAKQHDIDATLTVAKLLQQDEKKIDEALTFYEKAIDHAAQQCNIEKLVITVEQLILLKKKIFLLPAQNGKTHELIITAYDHLCSDELRTYAMQQPEEIGKAHEMIERELASQKSTPTISGEKPISGEKHYLNTLEYVHFLLKYTGITALYEPHRTNKNEIEKAKLQELKKREDQLRIQINNAIKNPENTIRELFKLIQSIQSDDQDQDSKDYQLVEDALTQFLKAGETPLLKMAAQNNMCDGGWSAKYIQGLFYFNHSTNITQIHSSVVKKMQKESITLIEEMLNKHKKNYIVLTELHDLYYYALCRDSNPLSYYNNKYHLICQELINHPSANDTEIKSLKRCLISIIKFISDPLAKENAKLSLYKIDLKNGTANLLSQARDNYLPAIYELAKENIEHKTLLGYPKPCIRRGLFLSIHFLLLTLDVKTVENSGIAVEKLSEQKEFVRQFLQTQAQKTQTIKNQQSTEYQYALLAQWYLELSSVAEKIRHYGFNSKDILFAAATSQKFLEKSLPQFFDLVEEKKTTKEMKPEGLKDMIITHLNKGMLQALGFELNFDKKNLGDHISTIRETLSQALNQTQEEKIPPQSANTVSLRSQEFILPPAFVPHTIIPVENRYPQFNKPSPVLYTPPIIGPSDPKPSAPPIHPASLEGESLEEQIEVNSKAEVILDKTWDCTDTSNSDIYCSTNEESEEGQPGSYKEKESFLSPSTLRNRLLDFFSQGAIQQQTVTTSSQETINLLEFFNENIEEKQVTPSLLSTQAMPTFFNQKKEQKQDVTQYQIEKPKTKKDPKEVKMSRG